MNCSTLCLASRITDRTRPSAFFVVVAGWKLRLEQALAGGSKVVLGGETFGSRFFLSAAALGCRPALACRRWRSRQRSRSAQTNTRGGDGRLRGRETGLGSAARISGACRRCGVGRPVGGRGRGRGRRVVLRLLDRGRVIARQEPRLWEVLVFKRAFSPCGEISLNSRSDGRHLPKGSVLAADPHCRALVPQFFTET